ncbi:MAG: polysaccharide biosynthesis C-terminal domain-containing protein [Balneolaceae bacterium]
MGIIARQSTTNVLYTYLGMGLGAVLTLFLYPHILSPEAYGLTRILVSAGLLGAHLSHLGMRNTILRFTPVFKDDSERMRSFRTYTFLLPLAGFLLFGLLLHFFQEPIISLYENRSPLVGDYLHLLVPLTLAILYFELANSTLRSLKDSTSGSFVQDLLLRLVIILSLMLLWLEWISLDTFFRLFVSAYVLLPLWLLHLLARHGELRFSLRLTAISRSLRGSMKQYGLFTMLSGLTTMIVWNIDILMLGSLAGLDQTAVYAIAFYMGSVITVPQRSLEKILTPLIADHLRDRNLSRIGDLYRQSAHLQFLSGSFLLVTVWILADPILTLLPDIYREGSLVILIIGCGKLLDMATGANGSILLLSRFYRWDLLFNGLLVILTFFTNWMLIPRFGVEGAAVATTLSLLIYNTLKYLFVKYRLHLSPFTRSHLYILLWTAGTLVVLQQIPSSNLWSDLLLDTGVFLALWLVPLTFHGEFRQWREWRDRLRQRESE